MSGHDNDELEALKRAETLSPKLIFEVIRRDGVEELERPNKSLM